MASLRRREDPDEQDYSNLRGGGGFNGHTKWVVATFGALLVAALMGLAVRDRNGIDKEQERQDREIQQLRDAVGKISSTQAGMESTLKSIQASVERIEARVVR